jgi:hypothetical protein
MMERGQLLCCNNRRAVSGWRNLPGLLPRKRWSSFLQGFVVAETRQSRRLVGWGKMKKMG